MKLKRGKKAFVRVFGTIRATLKTGDKGVTVFHNLDADAISEVYISDSALRQPKDSGQRKNARGMSARRVITMSVLFRHIFTKQPNPPRPRKSLGWGVWLPARVGLGLKTAVKRDAVLCGATCRKIFVFPTYESVCV